MPHTAYRNLPNKQLDNPFIFYALCLFFSVFLLFLILYPAYLPMVDLPQQVSQIAMWKAYNAGTLVDLNKFELHLFSPYLGGYLIMRALSQYMSLDLAARLTLFIALITPLAALFYAIRSKPFLRWSIFLAIPFLFNWNFYWGFLNFLTAIGPSLFCLFISIKWIDEKPDKCHYIIGICALILFFFHILPSFMYLGLIGVYLLVKTGNIKRCLPSIAGLIPFILLVSVWLWLGILEKKTEVVSDTWWRLGINRIIEIPNTMLSGDYYGESLALIVLSATSLLLLGMLLCCKINKERFLLVLLVLLAYLVLPHYTHTTFFVYQRFSFLLVPLIIFAIADSEIKNLWFARTLQLGSIMIPTLFLSQLLGAFITFGEEGLQFKAISDHMEKDKRVLSMMFDNTASSIAGPTMLHFPVWYQTTHGGIVDFNFASFGCLMKYKKDCKPMADASFVWRPTLFNWEKFERYDYYVVKYPVQINKFPIKAAQGNFDLLYRMGGWHLFVPKPQIMTKTILE